MSKTPLIATGVVVAGAALAILVVLPAETGWDPTGVGAALGLTQIADPVGPETERGQARMAAQDVLTLSETAAEPAGGYTDVWEYELAPFEGIEFKYTIAGGDPIEFEWAASGPLHYDMHAHPFDGGVELTESYGIGEATRMGGRYTPAFSGIHGWFWENRSLDNVTLTLRAAGGMTHSTIFSGDAVAERPIEGVTEVLEGTVEGHRMQEPAAE